MKKKIFEILLCILLIITAFPVASQATNWTVMQKLIISYGAEGDVFGWSVSLSGDTALIGAKGYDGMGVDSGSAYMTTRSGTNWTQHVMLLASDGAAQDIFGCSVSLDDDTALIGAPGSLINDFGSVYVFTGVGTTWTQQAKLLASDEAEGDVFGYSVSLSGDTALIGAKWDDDKGESSGSVYVFIRNGTTWVQQAKLLASDGAAQDIFGCSVSLDDDTALVGSKGSAYVFTRSDTSWTQQAKLITSDGGVGNYFGYSVSLSDETVLIGAPAANDNGNNSGSAYVFIRTGTTWTQQAKLIASDGVANDLFGSSVSLSGENALIGAKWDDDNGLGSGSAYVFTRTGANWTQQVKLIAPDGAENDEFGYSVSLFGDIALIAAPKDDNNKNASGSVYVFTKGGDNEPPKTPGFEIIVIIGAIALVMFWKRKRKHVD